MSSIYLRNHDHFALVLSYSLEDGGCKEIKRIAMPVGEVLWRGYYITVRDSYYGYYASSEGPVFFHDKERYMLADQQYGAEVKSGSVENLFVLKHNDRSCVEVNYLPVGYSSHDNWSDDTTIDFFLWIKDALSSERRTQFIQSNTLPDLSK